MKKKTIEGLREAVKNGFTPHRTTIIALLDIAERTTSPVSQMTDEQAWEVIKAEQGTQVTDWRGRTAIVIESPSEAGDVVRAILAAAAPHAQAPAAPVAEPQTVRGDAADPAPIYKHHVDGKVTLINADKMPSYATQPQPVAEQGELPRYSPSVVDGVAGMMDNPAGSYVLWKDAQVAIAASQPAHDSDAAKRLRLICKLVGIESHVPADDETLWGAAFAVLGQIRAALEASQQDAIGKFTIEVEKLLCAKLGRPWSATGISIESLADELAARASQQATEPGAYCYYCSEGYSHSCPAHKPAAPAIQQPQDERVAMMEKALKDVTNVLDAFGDLPDGQMCPRSWSNHQAQMRIDAARAALAKKGGAE